MKSLIQTIKESYSATPALKANFKDFNEVLADVNRRRTEQDEATISADALREALLEINPQTRFEPQFTLDGRTFEAVRTIFEIERPPLTPEQRDEARTRVTEILERTLAPMPEGYYALATIGELLRANRFDTRDYGGRGVKQLLAEIYPDDMANAEYDDEHSPHHYLQLTSIHPHGVMAVRRDPAEEPYRREPSPYLDIVDLRRRFEFILTSSVPAPDGWYELVKITPALKARLFDFRRMGFNSLSELLRTLYGDALEIVDRGDADHPNKKYMRLPDDDQLHMLPDAMPGATRMSRPVRTYEPREERPHRRNLDDGHEKNALEKLMDFAFFPGPAGHNGLDLALRHLAMIARPERWYYGRRDPGTHPLLKNFLTLTFERLQYEDSVGADDPRYEPKIMVVGTFATFNTGLCDHYNEPIYALFKQNERTTDARPWTFVAFVGSRAMGQYDMTAKFGARLPQPAHYYNSTAELAFDVRCDIAVPNLDHYIDHCNRLPIDFLRYFGPQHFDYDRPRTREFFEELAEAIKDDPIVLSQIRDQLEAAINRAKGMLRWNYRRAIPIYYPKGKEISLLLPLQLGNSQKPNVALVMRMTPSGDYEATTIYTLGMAYAGARLLCGPENEWLKITDVFGPIM